MEYSALLSPGEAHLLLTLQHGPLGSTGTDGWGVYIRSEQMALAFLPEEVSAPDTLHPHGDVVRVRVERWTPGTSGPGYRELASSLGTIQRLAVMTTAISYSSPVHSDAVERHEVTIPTGMDYSCRYLHPDDPACAILAESPDSALSLVDIGISMETEEGSVTVATDGCGYFVHLAVGRPTHESLLALDGKVLFAPVSLRL
jgi:hypothetical protein